MFLILTSTKLAESSLHNTNTDFMITALYADRDTVNDTAVSVYKNERFDTYYRDGMDMETVIEENTPGPDDPDTNEYNFIPMRCVEETIDAVFDEARKYEENNLVIIVAIDGEMGRKISSKLNKMFRSKSIEMEAINLFAYYKITSMEKLVQMMKMSLNSNFVYDEDPLVFAYAIYRYITKR